MFFTSETFMLLTNILGSLTALCKNKIRLILAAIRAALSE